MINKVWNIIRNFSFIELEKYIAVKPFRSKNAVTNKIGRHSFYVIQNLHL